MPRLLPALACFFAALPALCGTPASSGKISKFKKVMIVVFENTDYDQALAQPFFSKLVSEGALLSNFYGETHPSQPNYVALVSGSTQGVTSDSPTDLNGRHLGDLLEAKGLDWKVYAEQYPGNCFTGARSGEYARKHNPFISFTNVSGDPSRCAKIVNASSLSADIRVGKLPAFSLYVPNLQNDGHDTDPSYADRWLAKAFGPLLADPRFSQDMLFVVTFDESGFLGGNHIFTLLYGSGVKPGSVTAAKLNHYNILRMIEDEFELGTLGQNDLQATAISGVWN